MCTLLLGVGLGPGRVLGRVLGHNCSPGGGGAPGGVRGGAPGTSCAASRGRGRAWCMSSYVHNMSRDGQHITGPVKNKVTALINHHGCMGDLRIKTVIFNIQGMHT